MMASQQFHRTWWQPSMLAVLLSVACSDSVGMPAPPAPLASDPVLAAALSVTMDAAAGAPIAYVALDPGTIGAGTTATVSDHVSGAVRTAPVVNGGFDPVGVPANVGDTLVVSVATTAGQVVVASVVARPHPPHVVRVSPAKNQVDVPVNTNLTVVFNEPVSVGTLTPATMQLRQGTTSVPGTIAVDLATPWIATFTPAQPLLSGATYKFTVTGAITDPSGLMLDAPVTSTFVTVDPAPIASVAISPPTVELAGPTQLTATATDANGHPVAGLSYVWTSSDTSIASVDGTGLVTPSRQFFGSVQITATTAGRTGIATLNATCANLASSCGGNFVPAAGSVVGSFRELLPDGTTRPVPNARYYAWVQSSGSGYSTGWRFADATGAYRIDSLPGGVVMINSGGQRFVQPCMAVGSTNGQNGLLNVTLVDSLNPLPQLTTTAPAVTGTVYQLVNGVQTPVAGTMLQYQTWVPDLVVAETVSDSSGHYAFCSLQFTLFGARPSGQVGYVTAYSPSNPHAIGSSTTVTVSGPGTVDIVVP
jgi:hypothetical protein